jgi:hypothetical protein
MWVRVGTDLIDRVSGPMKFRLYMQPAMAAVLATISGWHDAKAHLPPFFWAIGTVAGERLERIKDGWKSIGRVFILALVLDVVYQIIELRFVYPGEAVIVAFILAIVPYMLLRGLANRLFSMKIFSKVPEERR